jgi:hypothetical protein
MVLVLAATGVSWFLLSQKAQSWSRLLLPLAASLLLLSLYRLSFSPLVPGSHRQKRYQVLLLLLTMSGLLAAGGLALLDLLSREARQRFTFFGSWCSPSAPRALPRTPTERSPGRQPARTQNIRREQLLNGSSWCVVRLSGARDARALTRLLAHAKAPGPADQASRRSRRPLVASIPQFSFSEHEELIRMTGISNSNTQNTNQKGPTREPAQDEHQH